MCTRLLRESKVRRSAAEKLPVPERSDEFTVARLDFATYRHHTRSAHDFPTLESAVVDVHLLGLGRDGTAIVGIERE